MRKLKLAAAISLMLLISILSISTADNSKADTKKIKLNTKEVTLRIGEKKKIKVKTDLKVKWKSGNKKIATVNNKGIVKAKKAGIVRITVSARKDKNIKTVCKVIVKEMNNTEQVDNTDADTLHKDGKVVQINDANRPAPGNYWLITNLKIISITSKTDGIATIRLQSTKEDNPGIPTDINYVETDADISGIAGLVVGDTVFISNTFGMSQFETKDDVMYITNFPKISKQ